MKDSRWSVRLRRSADTWAFGWCGAFAMFGIGVMCLGPFNLNVTWPLSV